MSDVFQMHGLGDSNYKVKTIVTNGYINNNDLEVIIDADYAKALHSIDVSSGVVSHGETGAARTVLNNFNTLVFSDGSMSVPVVKLASSTISIYPNPVRVGQTLTIDADESLDTSVEIYDMTGKVYSNIIASPDKKNIQFLDAGWYILNLKKEGQVITSQKISVTHE